MNLRQSIAAVWGLGLAGCMDLKETQGPELIFVLDAEQVRAGDVVAWTARLRQEDGTEQAATVDIRSDHQADLDYSGVHLFPRVAGEHRLVARTSIDGNALIASAPLTVDAGPASTLHFELEAGVVAAGEAVGYTATVEDAFANPIAADAVVLDVPDALRLEGSHISGETPGVWDITASVDGLTTEAQLEVVPAAPARVELDVTLFGDTARAETRVFDGHGNPMAAGVVLSVDGRIPFTVNGSVVFFHGEGAATIHACVRDAPDVCSDGVPVVIDWSAPELTVDDPPRGAWWTAGPQPISGTVSDLDSVGIEVTVNGEPATMDGAEGWSSAAPEQTHGMVVLETVATDSRGQRVRDTRAVVVGDILPLQTRQADGLIVRLDEDDAGIGVVERIALDELAAVDLADEMPDPVYDARKNSCYTPPIGPQVCVVNSMEITVSSMRYSGATLELDGWSDGSLHGELVWTDYEVDWSATGKLNDVSFTESGTGTADALVMDFQLHFSVAADVITVTASDVEVSLTNFDLDSSSKVTNTGSNLGVDSDDILADAVETAAEEALPPVLEDAVDDALLDLNVDVGWDWGSTLTARPTAVAVDGNGMVLSFGSIADVDTWLLPHDPMGALTADYSGPEWSTRPHPASMALSYNLLNQIFHANWGGAFLELEGDADLFRIDPTVFTAVLPGITDLVGTVSATYPPFFVPDGEGGTRLEMPELRIDFYDLEAIEGTEVYTIYIAGSTPVAFGLSGNRLDITWGTQDVWMDVDKAPPSADLYFLEVLLESFTAGLVLSEYELVDALPLPTIGGSELQGEAVSIQGPEGAFVVVDGGF